MDGLNRLAIFHCLAISLLLFQVPVASPARYAAPEAVVSVLEGRITGGVQQVALEMHQQVVGAGAGVDTKLAELGSGVTLHRGDNVVDLKRDSLEHGPGDVRPGSAHGTSSTR